MTSTLGGKSSRSTKSTLAVTGVIIDGRVWIESLAWTSQPLLYTQMCEYCVYLGDCAGVEHSWCINERTGSFGTVNHTADCQ